VKNTYEVSAKPGEELTLQEIERFVQQVRTQGAGAMATRVKAKVRFNGTLRGLSVEVDDQPILGQRPSTQQATGVYDAPKARPGADGMNSVDDAWLAQQW
jgi:hypothetical protein